MVRNGTGKTNGSVSVSVLGLLVFLGGVVLLLFTFKLAYEMFMVPPQTALGIKPKEPLDLGMAGQSFVGLILKVLVLIVMGLVGSLIANRGISLFAGSRAHPPPPPGDRTTVVEERPRVADSEEI